ncbi:MAG: hypothetical protein LIO70_06905 [Clostridiales bacterium]|nr:hypothetical protein [Clostridiales bacterium]
MTDDYISRTALLERIEAQRCDGRTGTCKDCDTKTFCVYGIVEAFPAADVAPVKHGEWQPPVIGKYGCVCSICKAQADNDFDYCPNCGARMDGGADNA